MMNSFPGGDANAVTRAYFDSLFVELRQLDSGIPDTSLTLFGERFETPVMMAALSHLNSCHEDGMAEMARGARQAGSVNWAGMGDNAELGRILDTGARTIKIVKPYADEEKIFSRIRFAEEHGCMAVGMDIDHSFGGDGRFDVVLGEEMNAKSLDDLKRYIASTRLPFVVKGVLSVRDAVKCADAGAKAIVISHHHGIMKYALPPLYMLPSIKNAVGNSVKIFVDCGVESGYDAFKALALGADAVCAGRVVMGPLKENGAQGVADTVRRMTDELRQMMARTGAKTIGEIDPGVIHRL